jgi:hypothetical protein
VRNFTIVDVAQRSPEWIAARLGRLTASKAGDMLAVIKSGQPAASRTNLRMQLMLERLTGKPQEREFMSQAMQDGINRESHAIGAYEALTGELVQTSGFLSHTELMTGCSLDGHLGDFETLLSVKCRQPAGHMEFLRTGKVPADALAQMRHELWMTGAAEHHYLSWNPDFPEPLQSRLVVVKADTLELPAYELLVRAFLREVDEGLAELTAMAVAS